MCVSSLSQKKEESSFEKIKNGGWENKIKNICGCFFLIPYCNNKFWGDFFPFIYFSFLSPVSDSVYSACKLCEKTQKH
jgi:hypothetical protein